MKNKGRKTLVITIITLICSVLGVFSIGFSSWFVGGSTLLGTNILASDANTIAADYNVVSDGNQSYIDMRFSKQYQKSALIKAATDNANNTKNYETAKATLTWKNTNSSYNDDVTNYFYLTDNDNPMAENAPHMYNHETGDTIGFDKEQKIYTNSNQFVTSMLYGNNFQRFQNDYTPSTNYWQNFEPVYDTKYENTYADGGSSASSYGGQWITAATHFTGTDFSWFRADLRCLQKNNRYYFFILYVFHFTKAHPYSEGRVCRYRVNALTTYSSQNIESLSDFQYLSSYSSYTSGELVSASSSKYIASYFRVCYKYKRTAAGTSYTNSYFTVYPSTPYGSDGVTYASNAYYGYNTSAYVNLTNPSNYKDINSRPIYREVDYDMPIVANAWVTATSSTELTWSYSYTYYIKHYSAATSRTGTLKTPLDYEFDHFELTYPNQYQTTNSGKFYFKNKTSGEILMRYYSDNISIRGRYYLYKMFDRVNTDLITFDYYVRLRPKTNDVKANMVNILKAYTYSLSFEIISEEAANIARVS